MEKTEKVIRNHGIFCNLISTNTVYALSHALIFHISTSGIKEYIALFQSQDCVKTLLDY